MASSSPEFPHNNYATKKTITQGLLDIALLTANASQLKFVLEAGESHPYYVLLVTLLAVSIALQLLRGCMNVVLGSLYNISEEGHQTAASILNNIVLALGALSTVVNAIISSFDMSESVVG
ncbi:ninjurin-2-like [Zootermopsis nevadensis]|uniref:ninjurin-2-like n=1 Tax=Zootermopsis nevadensis TaxID=136037 RepID=UPI000B8E55B7|nr:ninjurin-2-like [Zootermopsis nevadensis]